MSPQIRGMVLALILSGIGAHERDDVCEAFTPATVFWEREEDGWVGVAMKKL